MFLCLLMLVAAALPLKAQDEPMEDADTYAEEPAIAAEAIPEPEPEPSKNATQHYLEQPIKPKGMDRDTWDKKRKGMEFGEKLEEKPKEDTSQAHQDDGSNFSLNLGPLAQIILIVSIILMLALLVFAVVQQGWFNSNTRISGGDSKRILNLEDIEENLHESDLDRALRLALEAGDYRMAIRIYYLSVIKELSALNWIKWKRDKTNGQYVREMGEKPGNEAFRQLTVAFDRVWYSDEDIVQRHYEVLSPQFKAFIGNLKKR